MEVEKYEGEGLNLDFYPQFLDNHESLYEEMEALFIHKPNIRENKTFGDVDYTIRFNNGVVTRKAIPWIPSLLETKKKLERMTNETYTVCVVQRYPSGRIGIKPHRDKEMVKSTTICGISLGQSRTLTMSRRGTNLHILLQSGSLYVFNPPTNDYWTHSIEVDSSTRPRISLTFRNYKP